MDSSIGPWLELTDRVFVSRCEPAGVNIGLVVGDDHVLMIDAGSHPEQGRRLAESAAGLAGRPVDRLVITHWHWDHWFGAKGVGAEVVVGHERLAQWREHPGVRAGAPQYGVAPADILPPTEPMSLARAFDLGGVRAEVLHLGAAHTDTDLMVFVPEEDVIFVGDLLEEGADPQFGPSTEVGGWPGVLDGALGAATDQTRFVPGHGKAVDRMFAFRQRAEIAMLYAEAERLARAGVGADEAPGASSWPFSPQTLEAALPIVYAELARRGIRPHRRLPLL
ncbi:MAG: MBL fold metallo-hydrolase [Propionibacteriaceae bacterium]|nr:MBL fold metallo-hydrolase [Propionibacteriaceae bacterium]